MRLGSLGPTELILIVLAIILIFGASKLGDIGGALGKSIKEFKKSSRDEDVADAVHKEQMEQIEAKASEPVATVAPPDRGAPVSVGDFRPPDSKPTS
ncbi:MAG: twin-arginine translocase TatA/TatE family subunit [Dehalococcoidia bacterium]